MPNIPFHSIIGIGTYIFKILELFIGVKFKRENLNMRNSFDAAMIVLATYFVFPIYSGYLDIFVAAVPEEVVSILGFELSVNRFAVEGFRFTFLLSSVWLILIALFSKAKFSILKFISLVIPGLVLGIVLTFLLTYLVEFFQGLFKLDEITLFVMTIYPLLFSYFVRSKISQKTRPQERPEPPKLICRNRNVYVE